MLKNISAIIVSENNSSTLVKCIDSVCSSTLKPIRIVIVDNDSKDGSYELLCKLLGAVPIEVNGQTGLPPEYTGRYNDVELTIVRKRYTSLSHSRNIGLKFCPQQTNYIAFVNPRSMWGNDKIEKSIVALDGGIEIGSVVSDFYVGDDRVFVKPFKYRLLQEKAISYDDNFVLKAQILNMMNRGFNPDCDHNEFLLRASEVGMIYNIPEALYHYG